MPTYVAECSACHKTQDYYRTVDERHDTPSCDCGGETKLILMPTYVQDDIPAYVSTTTGRVIGSRKTRRDDLARSGCRPWEGLAAEKSEAERQRKYAEQKFDSAIERGVREAYHQKLTPSQRREIEGR